MKKNQLLYSMIVFCAAFSLFLAWIPSANIYGCVFAVIALLVSAVSMMMHRTVIGSKFLLPLFLSVLAILITIFVQVAVENVHQVAVQRSSNQFKKKTHKIGEDVTVETEQFRVNGITYSNQVGSHVAKQGNKIAAISISIKNLAEKDFGTGRADLPYSSKMFPVQANEEVVEPLSGDDLPNALPEDGMLPVKGSVTGNVYVEVPEKSDLTLVYTVTMGAEESNGRVPLFKVALN